METAWFQCAEVTDRAKGVTDSGAFWTSSEYLMLLEALPKHFTSCNESAVARGIISYNNISL